MGKRDRIKYREIIAVFFFIFLSSFIWGVDPDPDFSTLTEKQINTLKTIIVDMTKQMMIIDNEITNVKKSAEKTRLFYLENINNKTIPPDNSLKIWIDEKIQNWKKIKFKTSLTNAMIKDLEATPINEPDITSFYETYLPCFKEYVDYFYTNINIIATTPSDTWWLDSKKLIDLWDELIQLDGNLMYYGMWTILTVLPESICESFDKQWPLFINFPQKMPDSISDIYIYMESEFEKQEKIDLEMAVIIGDNDKSVQKLSKQIDKIKNLINSIKETRQELDTLYEKARKKYAATKDESIETIWGKTLRLLKLKLRNEAVTNLKIYLEKIRKTDPDTSQNIQTIINFINAFNETGIDYGVIVAGYETGKSHKEIKIGDIIIDIDGQKVLNCTSYVKIKTAMTKKTFKIKVLRFLQDGAWQILSINYNQNDCKFRVLTIDESDY